MIESRKWASREILGQKGKELEARNSEEMFLLDHMRRYTGIELLDLLADVSKKRITPPTTN